MSKINAKLRVHRLLDRKMKDKFISIMDLLGDQAGPYISHRHDFKRGITSVTFLCTSEWCGEEDKYPKEVRTIQFMDDDLDAIAIDVCSAIGADYHKEQYFKGEKNVQMDSR